MTNTLETLFDIEENSTIPQFPILEDKKLSTEVVNAKTGEIMELTVEDSEEDQNKAERIEDIQLQQQFDTIYRQALGAYEAQADIAGSVDPQFSARNAEVAAQFLTIALNSTKDRVDAKYKRQKIKIIKNNGKTPSTINNNLVVTANRNELLKMLSGKEEIINEK